MGLIRSQRGAKGGYILANPPEKIKLSDVFDVFEGPVVTVECVAVMTNTAIRPELYRQTCMV